MPKRKPQDQQNEPQGEAQSPQAGQSKVTQESSPQMTKDATKKAAAKVAAKKSTTKKTQQPATKKPATKKVTKKAASTRTAKAKADTAASAEEATPADSVAAKKAATKKAATKRATAKATPAKKTGERSGTSTQAKVKAGDRQTSAEIGTEADVTPTKKPAKKTTNRRGKTAASEGAKVNATSNSDGESQSDAKAAELAAEIAESAPLKTTSAKKATTKKPASKKAAPKAGTKAQSATASDESVTDGRPAESSDKAEAAFIAAEAQETANKVAPKQADQKTAAKKSTTAKKTGGEKSTAAKPSGPSGKKAAAKAEARELSDEPLVLRRSKAKGNEQRGGDGNLSLGELEGLEGVEPVHAGDSADLVRLSGPVLGGEGEGPQAITHLPELEGVAGMPPVTKSGDPVQDALLEQLRELGRPVHVRDLAQSFTRREAEDLGDWREIGRVLDDMARTGLVVRTRKRTYGLPDAMNLVRGRFQASSAGFGFVVPDTGRDDYYVAAEDTMEAWNGDTVLVRPEGSHGAREEESLHSFDRRGGRNARRGGKRGGGVGGRGNPTATVVRIVERKASQLVGTLEFSHGYPLLRPDDHRARHRIFVLPDGTEELETGARVVADLYWPELTGEDEVFGEVVRVLGTEDDPETETEAVMVTHGLRGEFPEEVLHEARAIPREIAEEALAGRLDLRAANTFTVDGRDAKDFDDAIHIEPTERGTFIIGVHIADVSHYVRAGSELDAEAYARATSVYLPGRVLPMLPEHLSNGVCSLVPNEDRLTMSALVELSAEAEILDVQLTPSVIHSKARLTYDEVQAYSEATSPLPVEARALEGDLHLLLKMAARLRSIRLNEGSLNFKLREVKVDIDEDGHMELTELREETARGMIEDLMLLANKVVARFLVSQGIPALFRIHEEPTLQRFQEVAGALGRLGLGFPGGEPTPQAYQAVLGQVRGTPRESVVNTLLLRSMQQAKYAPANLGHFGLAFEDYLHFTSPIRRYPDLLVHRILREVLAGHLRKGTEQLGALEAVLPKMAEHTSERERAATEAERDLTKYYQARWARQYIGQSFMGRVSGVVASGLFVALENGVEGKLHISNLDDDYYIYLEDSQILRGRSRGKMYRLGDAVPVTIHEAKPLARQIDFVMPEAGAKLTVLGDEAEEGATVPEAEDNTETEGGSSDQRARGEGRGGHLKQGNRGRGSRGRSDPAEDARRAKNRSRRHNASLLEED